MGAALITDRTSPRERRRTGIHSGSDSRCAKGSILVIGTFGREIAEFPAIGNTIRP
jgi:hypothetical protein